MSPFWILLELSMLEVVVTARATGHGKVQSKCHYQQTTTGFSCRRTNSIKALKGNSVIIIIIITLFIPFT